MTQTCKMSKTQDSLKTQDQTNAFKKFKLLILFEISFKIFDTDSDSSRSHHWTTRPGLVWRNAQEIP